jgi:menaquinol-cytochrome c reductase cytochrome b/c subunit
MADQPSQKVVFPKDGVKTYNLVELVRGRTNMIEKGPDNTIFSFPIVAILELLIALGTLAFLIIFSLVKNAPLEDVANPLLTTDPAKAPWYFMGLQEMLEHAHPLISGVILPTLMVLFVMAIPYLDNSRVGSGIWFTSARGKVITKWTAIYTAIAMPAFIALDNLFPPRELLRGVVPDFVAQSIIPVILIGLIVFLPVLVLMRWKPTAREIMLAMFTVLITSAVIFTIAGFFFRGPGFKLFWPWNMPNGYNPLNNL